MKPLIAEYKCVEDRVGRALHDALTEAEFAAVAFEVHAFQRRWNTPYAKFCATQPAPTQWWEIPAVPQSAFKRYRLSVASAEAVQRIFRTSGTTGEGYGEHHFVSTRLYDQAILAGWDRLKLPALRPLILTPSPSDAPHSSLAHMMGTLGDQRGRAPGTFFVGSDGTLRVDELLAALEAAFQKNEPVALLGTALSFLNLFERLGTRRPRLSPGSYALETGGYKGSGRSIPKAELYAQFGTHLGLAPDEVINEYGMTELSSQFYTRGLERPHQAGPWLRARVLDPETGDLVPIGATGVLRLFDLANLGSVLAIETQDLAIRHQDGFALLGRDPGALPRGCSRSADEQMQGA